MLVMQKAEKEPLMDEEDLGYDEQLMKELRGVRHELADAEHVPAYNIVTDNTLTELAMYLPQSFDEMKNISGIGDYKLAKYGGAFLQVVQRFTQANGLASKMHLKAPKTLRKSTVKEIRPATNGTQQATLALFRDGMGIEEIAAQRGLTVSTIETHLARFVAAGDIDIHQLVSPEKLEKITEAIQLSGQRIAIKPIKDILGEDFSYGEIRIVLEYQKK